MMWRSIRARQLSLGFSPSGRFIAVPAFAGGARYFDTRIVYVDESGPKDKRLKRLAIMDQDGANVRLLSQGRELVLTPRFSPTTQEITFLQYVGDLPRVMLMNIDTGQREAVGNFQGMTFAPRFSPDGQRLVMSLGNGGDTGLVELDLRSKQVRNLTVAHTGPIGNVEFTPDSRYAYFNGGWGTARWPRRLEIATGRIDNLATSAGLMNVSSWSRDRSTYLYTYQDFNTPADLYVGRVEQTGDRQRRVTDANPWVRDSIAMGALQLMQWKSVKDFTIEGLLHTPAGYDAAAKKPIPLLLSIHGGPAGVWTNSFSLINHVYNGLGYALLSPNVRGSVAYDDKLMRGNLMDIGGGDYQDLMTGVDAVIARGITTPDSIAVRGWSYGGILGGWTITQTPRFKAASLGAMVSDWTSEYGPGFNFDVSLWYIGGDPWTNAKGFREKSPLTYVNQVKTPTLLLHGDDDITDTPAQSMNFFAGLQRFGVPSRYIRFPNEPHGFGKMKHQRVRDSEEIQWMQSYVRGLKDYTYPEPPSEKKKPPTPTVVP